MQVSNENNKQNLEFNIVNNTLAQQGSERVFVLRYLAKTLDDEDAKGWAEEEVSRLEKIAELEAELTKTEVELIASQSSNKKTPNAFEGSSGVEALRNEVVRLRNEVQRMNSVAGIATTSNQLEPNGTAVDAICSAEIMVDDFDVTVLEETNSNFIYRAELRAPNELPSACALVPVIIDRFGTAWMQDHGWITRLDADGFGRSGSISVSKTSSYPLRLKYHLLREDALRPLLRTSRFRFSALSRQSQIAHAGFECELSDTEPHVTCWQ